MRAALGKPDDAAEHSLDLGLFDAAVASAAFPFVTPSIVLKGWHGWNVSLVDGGYVRRLPKPLVNDLPSTKAISDCDRRIGHCRDDV